ncbi:MAG: hypothetical protein F6K19_23410 [Cyanothece sp. SIO1E1]|nr:hypothetical protein [Cyanothece sp. SIO1E1]
MVHQGRDRLDGDVFEYEQERFWQQLRAELQRYKDKFKATNLELAKGLDISRQPLVDFMQSTRKDLPVRRSQLKRLWYQLTNPEDYEDRKLNQDGKLSREALKGEGSNRLLKAAGFLPDEDDENCVYINSDNKQQIQRIVAGLSNIPISGSGDFIDLIDALEKELISKAFSLKNQSVCENNEVTNYYEMSEDQINFWIQHWIQNNIYIEPSAEVFKKFRKAIYKLIRFGRYRLEDVEIFELYLSICEKKGLNRKNKLDRFESLYKIRISQCQFSTLTFSFSEFHHGNSNEIREVLEEASLEVESLLRFPARNLTYLKTLTSDVVVEALVSCILFRVDEGKEETISWRYSSSATHFENMLTAINQGMGCENELELVNFSLRSLGKKSESLIKSSITLSNSYSKYQGIWVDESSIFGTSQAMFVAATDWLTDNLSNNEEYLGYYQICKELAAINNSLNQGQKTLSDYVIRRNEYPGAVPVCESIRREVIEKIGAINLQVLDKLPVLKRLYGLDLERKKCMANLICARSSHVEGDLPTAKKLLARAKEVLKDPKLNEDVTLKSLFSCEEMLYLFYSGNKEFIEDKCWRYRFEDDLKNLQNYIYLEQEDCGFKKYCGRLDLNIYRSASEIFARVGRLDFCLSDSEDIVHLEKASSRLLMAAYCSAKVGDRQRAAHWVANASRTCCRLGLGSRAFVLASLAEEIIQGAVDNRYSSRYKEAIMAEVDIARAEKLLLIDGDCDSALRYFLSALKGAAYLGFSRLMADSLYGVWRASKEMYNCAFSISLDEVFSDNRKSIDEERWLFQKDLKGKKAKKLVVDVVHFINSLNGDDAWSAVAEKFRTQSKKIWHYWAVTAAQSEHAKHPVEEAIDSCQFLCKVRTMS